MTHSRLANPPLWWRIRPDSAGENHEDVRSTYPGLRFIFPAPTNLGAAQGGVSAKDFLALSSKDRKEFLLRKGGFWGVRQVRELWITYRLGFGIP